MSGPLAMSLTLAAFEITFSAVCWFAMRVR